MTTTDRPDTVHAQHWDEIRDMIAELLTATPEEVTQAVDFSESLDADSLVKIELLTRLEKRYGVQLPDDDLASLNTLRDTYQLVADRAKW